jgi:thioredoxin-related protein
MKRDVLNQPEVQQYFRERFLSFSVDVESDAALVDFAGDPTTQSAFAVEQQRVRATPVIAFFDLDGNVIARHTGAVSGPQEFLWLGEFVADGHYQTTQFSRFKRQKRQQMH